MKISNNFIISYVTTLCLFVISLNRFNIGEPAEQLQYGEFIIDFINIILSLIIYKNIKNNHKGFIFLPASFLLLFLMDVQYLVFFYLNSTNYTIYGAITFSWYLVTIVGLLLLLLKFVYEEKERILTLFSFIFVALVIIVFFAPNYVKYLDYPYYSICLTAHLTIFYLCVLLIMAIKNKYILLTICGLCFAEIGQFAMTECYLLDHKQGLIYGEFLWFVGLMTLSIGMLNIIKHKLFDVKCWFINSRSIRNKLSFLIFHISIWSFILACISMKELDKVADSTLVIIPVIGMAYSMIAAVLSVIIGKHIEKPFLIIKDNILSIFSERKISNNHELNLLEFKELQDFFVESYEYKKYIQKQVVSLATRMAHDIKSPILIIENLVKDIENQNNNSIKQQLIKQLNKINYISRSMLKENKIFDDKFYGIQSLFTISKDLISDKKIEWMEHEKIIDFEYITKEIIWLNNTQTKIKNILSNLLNNAYEASANRNREIKFIVNSQQSMAIIKIQDFGCGIPSNEINSVLSGKSLKLGGNGIGLSSAKKFIESINGKLTLESTIDVGTTVIIEFPITFISDQYATYISIPTSHVVILDDDPSIIRIWQEYFLLKERRQDIETIYFTNFSSLREFLEENSRKDTTYLLDYKVFGEKTNAIDIIKEFNLTNVYLITNYAEDEKLQEEIKSLSIKLIPKSMLSGYVAIDIDSSPKAGRTTENTI